MKTCHCCQRELEIEMFADSDLTDDGYTTLCVDCLMKYEIEDEVETEVLPSNTQSTNWFSVGMGTVFSLLAICAGGGWLAVILGFIAITCFLTSVI